MDESDGESLAQAAPRGLKPAAHLPVNHLPTDQISVSSHRWIESRWVEFLAAAAFGMVIMAYLQSQTPYVCSNDSYYHLRLARMLPEVGFIRQFPWLYWTNFRNEFVSHHHGFHVLLAPFVWMSERLTGELYWGGKIAAILSAGVSAGLFSLLLRRLRVGYRWVWILAMACMPWHFWLRHSYIRAPIVALPLMIAALSITLQRRYWTLAVLAFVFVHVYGGAVVFLLIPLAASGAAFAMGRPWRQISSAPIAALVGLALGLIIHPYFPANLRFMYTQLFETGLGASSEAGIEWRPFTTQFFLEMSWPLIATWLVCAGWRVARRTRITQTEMTLLLTNLALFALTCKSRRFIEYWPVFCLIHAAYIMSRATGRPMVMALKRRMSQFQRMCIAGAFAAAFIAIGIANLAEARVDIQPGADVETISRAMNFLKANSPVNSLVLTDDWDVFPYCFYFNQHNRYAVGLDPVFTSGLYPALWARYRAITRGQTPCPLPDDVVSILGAGPQMITIEDIATEFGASYVLVFADHAELREQLEKHRDKFECVYPPRADTRLGMSVAVRIYKVTAAKSQ